jgi:hypothetical protein
MYVMKAVLDGRTTQLIELAKVNPTRCALSGRNEGVTGTPPCPSGVRGSALFRLF